MPADATLEKLANVEHEPVVSVQIDLDPATTPTPADAHTRAHALIDELRRRKPPELSHQAAKQFDGTVARLEERIGNPFEMELPPGRHMGVVAFAWGDDQLEVFPVRHRIGDRVSVGRRPALADLAARAARADDLLFLVASREEGRLMRFHDGRAEDVFDDRVEGEQRHHQGGWAQMTLQRWVDNAGSGHLRDVVHHLERRYERLGRPPVLIGADDSARAVISRDLSKELQSSVVDWVGNEHDWGADRLVAQVESALVEVDRRTERDLLERWQAQQGERAGSPEDPLQDVLDQVSDGRVEWLLLPAAHDIPVVSCPNCGRLYAHPGHCPIDGSWLETDDAADAIACETLRRAGHVWELLDAENPALPQDTPGAVLRY